MLFKIGTDVLKLAHGFHFSFCAELWKGGEETTYPR